MPGDPLSTQLLFIEKVSVGVYIHKKYLLFQGKNIYESKIYKSWAVRTLLFFNSWSKYMIKYLVIVIVIGWVLAIASFEYHQKKRGKWRLLTWYQPPHVVHVSVVHCATDMFQAALQLAEACDCRLVCECITNVYNFQLICLKICCFSSRPSLFPPIG